MKKYVVYKILMSSYAIWIYGRSNLRLVLYLSHSTVIRIRSSHVCILRETVFFFFFQLVKDYYKDNKVEEHFKYDHTILESIQNDP